MLYGSFDCGCCEGWAGGQNLAPGASPRHILSMQPAYESIQLCFRAKDLFVFWVLLSFH